jgi:phosphatidylserine/phosphatidylglycerophosphate/cardiolipin synthase-like enzyme
MRTLISVLFLSALVPLTPLRAEPLSFLNRLFAAPAPPAASPAQPLKQNAQPSGTIPLPEVFFSPKGGCTQAIVRELKAARQSILVQAYSFTSAPIAAALGADELIAVDLQRDTTPGGSGWFTGEVRGVPSFREGKVARVEAWLAARNLGWQDVHSTFYSDSINALPLLEKANVPVATNPDDPLRAIAQARGWRILELFN